MKNHPKKDKKLYYVELFLVFCFVFSVAFGVKMYLDNGILKEVVASEMNVSKKEVEIITQNLHEASRSQNSTSIKELLSEGEYNGTK